MFTEEDIENGFQRFITTDILSEEQYLERELLAEIKSEYHAGKITLLFNFSMNHSIIVTNLAKLLGNSLDEDYQICLLNLLVYLPKSQRYVYPDVSVTRDKAKISRKTKKGLDALLNPKIIIEISTKDTAEYDMGEKMICYLKLKSLQQYVIVSSERKSIIIYTKDKNGDFKVKTYSENDEVLIEECKIPIDKIYRKVGFEVESEQDENQEKE